MTDKKAIPVKIENIEKGNVFTDGRSVFGLKGSKGETHWFEIASRSLTSLSIQMTDLARLSRFRANGNQFDLLPILYPINVQLGTDGLLPPFVGPSMKIARARDLIDYFCAVMDGYEDRLKITATNLGPVDEVVEWEFSFNLAPLAIVPLLIGEIIHHTRSCLDVMICDIARVRGKPTGKLRFPFGSNEAEFNKQAKVLNALGQDVRDRVSYLRPYKDGNDLLYALHKLDIIGKHQLIMPVYLAAAFRYKAVASILENPELDFSDLSFGVYNIALNEYGILETQFAGAHTNRNDVSFVIRHGDKLKFPVGFDPNRDLKIVEGGAQPCFPHMDGWPFPDKQVLPVINEMVELVRSVKMDFMDTFLPE